MPVDFVHDSDSAITSATKLVTSDFIGWLSVICDAVGSDVAGRRFEEKLWSTCCVLC